MPPPVIRTKRGKVFDIQIIQSHDFAKIVKGSRSRLLFKPLEKGMAKGLNVMLAESQKNITRMKAVLSGYLRNNFKKFIFRQSLDEMIGVLGNNTWYGIWVHEGQRVHRASARPRFIKPEGRTPADIHKIQLARLKVKKERPKGRRPFFEDAFFSKVEPVGNIMFQAAEQAVLRVVASAKKASTRKARR